MQILIHVHKLSKGKNNRGNITDIHHAPDLLNVLAACVIILSETMKDYPYICYIISRKFHTEFLKESHGVTSNMLQEWLHYD